MEDIKTLLQHHTEAITKSVKEGVSEEVKRHIDVLGENFDHKLKLIAESVSSIDQRLKTLTEIVVKNAKDIEEIKINIFAMKSDIEIIKNKLKRKVDMEEFEALEKRLSLLEARAHA